MAHRCIVNVRFNELDPNNHVNHASYVTYFEVGRAEALQWCGVPLESLSERGIRVFITSIEVNYKAPASAGDRLIVETSEGTQNRRATTQWSQRILCGEKVITTAVVVGVTVNKAGKPTRSPRWFTDALSRLTTDDVALTAVD